MTLNEFQKAKKAVNGGKDLEMVAKKTGWSVRTLTRVKKARSLKSYKELCNS